jgi:hypothetical protein
MKETEREDKSDNAIDSQCFSQLEDGNITWSRTRLNTYIY